MAAVTRAASHLHLLLRPCNDLRSLLRVHARFVVLGAFSDDVHSTRALLLNRYASLGRPDSALAVFDSAVAPSPILWNSIIRCYANAGEHEEAVGFYRRMLLNGVKPDKYTFTFLSKAWAAARCFSGGAALHGEIVRRGFMEDVFIETGLVDMYSRLGMTHSARELFDSMSEPDVVSWNSMISGMAQAGRPCEALALVTRMQLGGEVPNSVTLLNLFPAICELSAFLLCRAIHGFMIRRMICLPSVYNGLMDACCKCGRADVARKIFDGMLSMKDDVSWGTMISGYVQNGFFYEALELFDELRREQLALTQVAVVSALSAAAEIGDLARGTSIHDYAVRNGMYLDKMVKTMLLTMYARCGDLEKAKSLFYGMNERDVVAWSAMISAFVQVGHADEAFCLFQEMQIAGLVPNRVTIVGLLPVCADLPDLNIGKAIHCYALKSNFGQDVSVCTALIAMYAHGGSFDLAHALFNNLEGKDVIAWNSLINGYAQIGEGWKALEIFRQLRLEGLSPDPSTMVGALPACTCLNALEVGAGFHCLIVKNGFDSDLHVKNATIDMYAKCGDVSSAETLFRQSKSHCDVITWNTVITGYMHNGYASEALSTFQKMRSNGLKPNLVTLVSIIPAASFLAAFREGSALHCFVINIGFLSHVSIGNCLIDMYAKCGRLDNARAFFNQMDFKDIVSWNVMISGYAIHGLGKNAISLFLQMKDDRMEPDSVSFLGILSACRHAGLIDEGKELFETMTTQYHLGPHVEHYACLVDLLGRAGQLHEAWNLIQEMSMAPDAGVWGALLGACRMHCNVKLGEIALQNLVKLEPQNAAHYVSLSNIYTQVGRAADARRMRIAMKITGLNKTPGCSWVHIRNNIHAFKVGDRSHPQYENMCKLWNDLQEKMEEMGYVPDMRSVLHDVEEEEKESFLSGHSERLAISFALLSTEPDMPIQIIKNLRVCGDCHTVTKLVSRITNRMIIVRDSSRFHHFQDGICSCKDFW